MRAKLVFMITGLLALNCFADWTITPEEQEFKIQNGVYKATIERGNASPKYIKTIEFGELVVHVFLVDVYGTMMMIEEHGGLVFSKEGKYLGQHPYHYKIVSEGFTPKDIDQPLWTYSSETRILSIYNPTNFKTIEICAQEKCSQKEVVK